MFDGFFSSLSLSLGSRLTSLQHSVAEFFYVVLPHEFTNGYMDVLVQLYPVAALSFPMPMCACLSVCWIENDFTDFPFTAKSIRYTGASSITCTINTHTHSQTQLNVIRHTGIRLGIGSWNVSTVKCFDVKLNIQSEC